MLLTISILDGQVEMAGRATKGGAASGDARSIRPGAATWRRAARRDAARRRKAQRPGRLRSRKWRGLPI